MNPDYERHRRQVFLAIFIGYAGYYLVRKNFALAIPDILKEYPQYTKDMLGGVMSALSIAYGFSKFLMGAVSDRSNPRWFLPLGLALSCSILFVFGLAKGIYTSLTLMVVLQALNGWVNGMGWAPCGKTMVHWFSTKERGRVVSYWNVAHNIGSALVATIAVWGMELFHDWGAKFYFNASIALGIALLVLVLLRDTPQSCGLPSIEHYKNDFPEDYSDAHEEKLTFKQIFLGHIFKNYPLWMIAVANAFVYFVRYGIVDWVPTYLQTAKHFSFKDSGLAWSAFEWAAVPGTILCGWVSDRFFKSRRAPALILFMWLTLLGIVGYSFNGNGPLWIDIACLILIGFFIYGPLMVIGLYALELVPKKAAGAAAGFTGFFGYVFGSAFAGSGVGWLADHGGWGTVFGTMIACCLVTIFFVGLAQKGTKS